MKNSKINPELDLSDANEELKRWAKDNIKEDPERVCQILEEFRDMIYSRGDCLPHRTDDDFLLRFLRGRNFSIESAYKLLVGYYEFKENYTEIFENVTYDTLKRIGEHDIVSVPPYLDQMNRRLLIYKIGNWNPNAFTVNDVFKATMLILELAILEPNAQIRGGVCIFDLGNISMNQAWYMTPEIANKVFQIMVTSFPMKVHALHIVFQPWMFEILLNFFKPLLRDTMKKRIFFHGNDLASLHKHIDRDFLPQRYGGNCPDKNYYEEWIDGFKKNKKIKQEIESLGYSEE